MEIKNSFLVSICTSRRRCDVCSKEEPNVVHCAAFAWTCIYLHCPYWWTNFSERLFKSSKFVAGTSGGSDSVCLLVQKEDVSSYSSFHL